MNSRLTLAALAIVASVQVFAEEQVSREVLSFTRPTDGDLIGREQYVRSRYDDTLADIGERYALGYLELTLANPQIDPWLPGEGTNILLPQQFILPEAPREGIVLNTAEMRLYYFPPGAPAEVMTFPVSVGRGEWQTPIGQTQLVSKTLNPAWYPPASIRQEYAADGRELPRMVPPGPDNPLGKYALNLAIPGYLIHGTNRPFGIGMQVTHGCIRLHPNDIELLFEDVSKDDSVTIVYQPFKAGWYDGVLYLEAHPPLDHKADHGPDYDAMAQAIARAAEKVSGYWVNWDHARSIASSPDGLPHPIGRERHKPNQLTLR